METSCCPSKGWLLFINLIWIGVPLVRLSRVYDVNSRNNWGGRGIVILSRESRAPLWTLSCMNAFAWNQKPLRIFPRRRVHPFSATRFHCDEAYTASGLYSSVTGFCFNSKLRKCSEDLTLVVATKENWRPSQNLRCSVTGNSVRRSQRTYVQKVHDKQAV